MRSGEPGVEQQRRGGPDRPRRRNYGTEKDELPLSATCVVGQDGKVAYAFLDADYKKRAEPVDVLAALDRMRLAKR